ncbi:MAG: phosphoglucosamine mutase [Pelagibacterales bacterium]|nr:phosphoglucosamine mutase [Pelagibacterales bacterium]
MKKYFGTDGIRGEVNKGSITGEMFFRFGLAAGTYFSNQNKQRHKAIIAKDTRLSGYMLEPALVSGLISAGMDVLLLGPLPTNGLAMLTKSMKADLGIMLTASHNPHTDNGLKLFGPDGMKLSDKVEKQIEKLIDDKVEKYLVKPNSLGRAKRLEDATENYIEILKNIFPKSFNLSGIKIFLDCANGASYKSAPALLRELGAEVVAIGINPDGFNINKNCGSTHPELIQQSVKTHKADIGIAFDGDADRVIMCDEKGEIIDGDQIIAMIAKNWKKKKILKGGVVGTLMTNLGLENYFKTNNIKFHRADVGDRYVKEKMNSLKYNLGGEQSGHIILGNLATTGDGLLVALEVLNSLKNNGKASKVFSVFKKIPQVLENIKVKNKNIVENKSLKARIDQIDKSLKHEGRLLVRKSGTENFVRIMVESSDKKLIKDTLGEVKKLILNYA